MPDWVPLNFGLMRHPANWIIVVLMIVFASMGAHVIVSHYQQGE
jgi:hypothetical protein